jgi:hypothetical protein
MAAAMLFLFVMSSCYAGAPSKEFFNNFADSRLSLLVPVSMMVWRKDISVLSLAAVILTRGSGIGVCTLSW